MSTSLLYHAFGIVGYKLRATRYEGGQVIFCVEREEERLGCPRCGQDEVIRRGTVSRRWKMVPIGHRATWVEYDVQRLECRRCDVVRQVEVVEVGEVRPRQRPHSVVPEEVPPQRQTLETGQVR